MLQLLLQLRTKMHRTEHKPDAHQDKTTTKILTVVKHTQRKKPQMRRTHKDITTTVRGSNDVNTIIIIIGLNGASGNRTILEYALMQPAQLCPKNLRPQHFNMSLKQRKKGSGKWGQKMDPELGPPHPSTTRRPQIWGQKAYPQLRPQAVSALGHARSNGFRSHSTFG
jgi:hypothetical protein